MSSESDQPLTASGFLRAASWRVLRQPRFRAYFVGSMVSNLGTWLQNTAQLLLAYQFTHSAFAVGLITAAQFSGILLLGPWTGRLANRMGQKRILVGTQLVSAVIAAVMAVLQLNGRLTETGLFCGALGTGLALAFALPVQGAIVSALAPEQETRAAMAMNSVSYNIGRTLAPILYLVVLTSVGAGWAFACNAASFLVYAVTIVTAHPQPMPSQAPHSPDWAGLRLALRRPRILMLLAMVAAITVADDPVQVLGPPLARQVLAVSNVWPAYFLSALGIGTIIGSLLPIGHATLRQAAISLGFLAVSVLVFAAGYALWLSLCAAVAAGVAALLTGASAQALLLETAGPLRVTQVMTLWGIAWAGTKPIASMADGWLATSLGVRWAAAIVVTPAIGIVLLELFLRDKHRARMAKFLNRFDASPP
jgi:predicted MFS family arabinose efflux permease